MKSPAKTAPKEQDILTRSRRGIAGSARTMPEPLLDVIVLGIVLLVVQLLERGLVALVHEEDPSLRHDLVQHLVEQGTPELEADGFFGHPHEAVPADLVQAHVQRHQDVVLRGEVVVERRLGEPSCSAISRSEVPSKPFR